MPEMTGHGKLSARAYTKSGDKEIYDGDLIGLPGGGLAEFNLTVGYPDKNGNYYIDTSEALADVIELPYSCTTKYHGVKCEFKWNKLEYDIIITCHYYKKPNTKYTYVMACYLNKPVGKSIMNIFSLNVVFGLAGIPNQSVWLVSSNYNDTEYNGAYVNEFDDPKGNQKPTLFFQENNSTKITKTYGSPAPIPYNFTLKLA